MTSEELAQHVKETVEEATSRILGTGAAQYDTGGSQRFEALPLPDLFRETDEELLDLINYLVFLRLRIRGLANVRWAELWQPTLRSCPCTPADTNSPQVTGWEASARGAGSCYLKPTE